MCALDDSQEMLCWYAATVAACSDNDKVLVSAVRALGNLFNIQVQPLPPQPAASSQLLNHSTSKQDGSNGTSSVATSNARSQASHSGGNPTPEQGGKAEVQNVSEVWWGMLCQDQAWCYQGSQCLLASLNSQTEKVLPHPQDLACVILLAAAPTSAVRLLQTSLIAVQCIVCISVSYNHTQL